MMGERFKRGSFAWNDTGKSKMGCSVVAIWLVEERIVEKSDRSGVKMRTKKLQYLVLPERQRSVCENIIRAVSKGHVGIRCAII